MGICVKLVRVIMRKHLLTMMLAALAVAAVAQDFTNRDTLRYEDLTKFRVINAAVERPLASRLPAEMKGEVRDDVWYLAGCSAGVGICFSTDSRSIAMRYNVKRDFHMPHMADTGIKGVDMYIFDDDDNAWHFLNCNRPTKDSVQVKTFVDRLDGKMHHYMAYMPLYDGINWIEIGVDSTAVLSQPLVNSPRRERGKIVFYGTSILQGGCATRPGMVATSIIQRELDRECVNLGFSGHCRMDSCMARMMAAIPDVAAYVIDPVPNCTKLMCDTVTYGFINYLRTMRPEVPIVMVEGPMYSYAKYSSYYSAYLPEKNAEFRKNYERLKADNPKNLYYIDCDGLYGPDAEGTVDGIHFTDIGFQYYARKVGGVLQAILDKRTRE